MLKDHNHLEGIKLAERSYLHAVQQAAFKRGIVLPRDISRVETENDIPTNLVIRSGIGNEIKCKVLKAMEDLKFTKLEVNIIGADLPVSGKSCLY